MDREDTQGFKYEPLDFKADQIRLVRFKTTADGDIECQLENHGRDDRPGYVALSYTWEPAYPQKEILVNGKSYTVGNNLCQFLLSESRGHDDGSHYEYGPYYWIDQICINQTSTLEKNHQVGIMSTIYEKACEVVIWLGPERDDSDLAIEVVKSLPCFTSENLSTQEDPYIEWSRYFDCLQILDPVLVRVPRVLAALRLFTRRRYWSRIWVIQEIMFAGKIRVKCGRSQLGWADLENYAKMGTWWLLTSIVFAKEDEQQAQDEERFQLDTLHDVHRIPSEEDLLYRSWIDDGIFGGQKETISSQFSRIVAVKELWGFGYDWERRPLSLSQILTDYANQECGNPLDKVYGLLGLFGSGIVEVDYSLTPFTLFVQILRRAISWGDLTGIRDTLVESLSLDKWQISQFWAFFKGLQWIGCELRSVLDLACFLAYGSDDVDWYWHFVTFWRYTINPSNPRFSMDFESSPLPRMIDIQSYSEFALERRHLNDRLPQTLSESGRSFKYRIGGYMSSPAVDELDEEQDQLRGEISRILGSMDNGGSAVAQVLMSVWSQNQTPTLTARELETREELLGLMHKNVWDESEETHVKYLGRIQRDR